MKTSFIVVIGVLSFGSHKLQGQEVVLEKEAVAEQIAETLETLSEFPDRAMLYLELAELFYQIQEYHHVLTYTQLYEQRVAVNPTTSVLLKAKTYLKLGDVSRAKGLFQAVLEEEPNRLEALWGYMVGLFAVGDWNRGKAVLNKLHQLYPQSLQVQFSSLYIDYHLGIGESVLDQLMAFFDQSLQESYEQIFYAMLWGEERWELLDSYLYATLQQQVIPQFSHASKYLELLLEEGDLTKAVEYREQFAPWFTQEAYFWYLSALLSWEQEDWGRLMTDLVQALQLEPENDFYRLARLSKVL